LLIYIPFSLCLISIVGYSSIFLGKIIVKLKSLNKKIKKPKKKKKRSGNSRSSIVGDGS
jgi:hypothetical protein